MMTDDRDPILQNLFAEATHDLDGEAFTASVIAKTNSWKYRALAGFVLVTLLLVVGAWLFPLPVLGFTQLITRTLTITLIDLGDSWVAWLFAPINNIASLLVLSLKAMRMSWKKIIRSS